MGPIPNRFHEFTSSFKESSGPTHYAMLLFLFLYCSRLPEFIPQIRILGVLQFGLIVLMALMMRFSSFLALPGGKLILGFTIWTALCIPFSVWPGGTIANVQSGVRSLSAIAVVAAFITTKREAIRAMFVMGISMAFAASMAFVFGSSSANAGRLELSNSGTLGDPNYYCYYVLAGLPFLCLGVGLTTGFKRLAFLVLILPVMFVVGQTGSRMGVIALAAGMLFIFYVIPAQQKILLLAGTAGLSIIATVTLPPQIVARLTTMFASDDNTLDAQMAIGSTKSRQYLLRRGLEITAENPIIGVGPGMFSVAEGADAATQDLRGAWHATHNTYVQMSSETGIPGALLYIFAMYASFRGLNRIRKSSADIRVRQAVVFTQMSYVMVGVSLVFLSIGYGGLPYILIAISGSLQVALANEAAQRNRAMAAATN